MKKSIQIAIAVLVAALALTNIFGIDKFIAKKYSIYDFSNKVKSRKFNPSNTSIVPLKYLSEIPPCVIERYLEDTHDIVLVSWIVGRHDTRFLPFFKKNHCNNGDIYSGYLAGAAFWLSQFGGVPINSNDEFLMESANFDKFVAISRKNLRCERKNGTSDTNCAYADAALQLCQERLDMYNDKHEMSDLKLAKSFFSLAKNISHDRHIPGRGSADSQCFEAENLNSGNNFGQKELLTLLVNAPSEEYFLSQLKEKDIYHITLNDKDGKTIIFANGYATFRDNIAKEFILVDKKITIPCIPGDLERIVARGAAPFDVIDKLGLPSIADFHEGSLLNLTYLVNRSIGAKNSDGSCNSSITFEFKSNKLCDYRIQTVDNIDQKDMYEIFF